MNEDKPVSKRAKTKDVLRRAMWGFMALLFLVTGVGVGIYYFWQATRQDDQSQSQTAENTQADDCQFNLVQNQKTLPAPEVYKPQGDVTKLETSDLQTGSGQTVKAGDCVTVKYYGTLASDGKLFDENFTQPQALKFKLGSGQVIPGWDAGLVGMKSGGTRRLIIPSELAYGAHATGEIPANADLVFVVNLLSVN
jgi:peptidylprolyl isomerase